MSNSEGIEGVDYIILTAGDIAMLERAMSLTAQCVDLSDLCVDDDDQDDVT